MAHNEYKFTVNGTEETADHDVLKFEEIVKLAFPDIQPDPASNAFSVTFEHAESKPHHGSLALGAEVTVKKHGTIFDVVHTSRS